MKRAGYLIIGLGATASLLATLFLSLACQTTRTLVPKEEAMMEGSTIGEIAKNDCRCREEGKECMCEHGKCSSFCGGGDLEGSGDEHPYEQD
jgi:hypothetical protein